MPGRYSALTGVDYSEASIALCEAHLVEDGAPLATLVVGSLAALPFPDAAFQVRVWACARSAEGAPGEAAGCRSIHIPPCVRLAQVVHDKGTYDAWRLGDNPHEVYLAEVARVLVPGGLFVLSAVNWTADEVHRLFCTSASSGSHSPAAAPAAAVAASGSTSGDGASGGCAPSEPLVLPLFSPVTVLKGSSFKFGGVVGHNVVTVVLRRAAPT